MTAHQFSEKGTELINLQQYVTKVKKVPEREAILIFYDIVRVVANLHKVSGQINYIAFFYGLRVIATYCNKTPVKSVSGTYVTGFSSLCVIRFNYGVFKMLGSFLKPIFGVGLCSAVDVFYLK